MKPRNAWERLVLDLGEDGAKAEMRRRRALVKKPGWANNPQAAKNAIMKRWNAQKNNQDNQQAQEAVAGGESLPTHDS